MYRDNTAKKIEEIQFLLATGKNRPEVAKALGYKDATGLYQYASRNRLKWNPQKKNYDTIGNNGKLIEAVKPAADHPTGKEGNIIMMFERGMDGREIAKKLRFSSYQTMADFMKSKGYVWDEYKQNYVKKSKEIKKEPNIDEKSVVEKKVEKTNDDGHALDKYIGLLDMLLGNKDKLMNMFILEQQTIPRYILAGHPIYKTTGIIDPLDRLIKEFCNEKSITQKELFEVAVIEFLKKYGYQDEVKANLKI